MKISVCILSRGHPEALTGVIMGLWRLRTEKHEVRFLVGVDDDDPKTPKAIQEIKEIPTEKLLYSMKSRPITRGEVENRLLKDCQDQGDDVVTFMTDRTFCISPGWDEMIARAVTEQKYLGRVLWWSCPQDNVCAIPVIPKKWLEACDYKWSPEIFPFWFDDTWNQHIDLLIHGMPSLKVKATFSGQRGKTTRGRDFAFWLNVFDQTLPLRVTASQEMAAKLGVEWKERKNVLQYLENWSKQMNSGIESLEKTYGDPRDPGPEYAIAKERAEKMLAEMAEVRSEMEAAE